MKWSITTPPAERIIDFASMKAHLRLDDAGERDYVLELIDAATEYAQQAMETTLLLSGLTATYYTSEAILPLPRGPVVSVASVIDRDDYTLEDGTDYEVQRVGNEDRLVMLRSYTPPLVIAYTAGHAQPQDVPADIRQAIRCHVATLYAYRESVSATPLAAVPDQLAAFYARHSRAIPIG